MSAKRPGLGRSLSALLQVAEEGEPNQKEPTLHMLPITSLRAGEYQPRGEMDQAALQTLADSIAKQGMLQPIVVRKCDSSYEIIAGERRFRASQLAKLKEVPVIVREVNDQTVLALALIENLQREALNAMDEARALARLHEEFDLTHQEIAGLLSKSRTAVSNSLRLLKLNDKVKIMLEKGMLEMGHARALLNLPDEEQHDIAEMIVHQGLSVRKAEALVQARKLALSRGPFDDMPKAAMPDVIEKAFDGALKDVLNGLSDTLGAQVQLKSNARGRGRLWVDFKNASDLKRLIAQLSKQSEMETIG